MYILDHLITRSTYMCALYHDYSSYGQLIYTLKNCQSQVLSLCWCDDMNVAIGYKEGGVHVVNIVSGETLKTFQRREGSGGITTLAYVELNDGSVYLWTVTKEW